NSGGTKEAQYRAEFDAAISSHSSVGAKQDYIDAQIAIVNNNGGDTTEEVSARSQALESISEVLASMKTQTAGLEATVETLQNEGLFQDVLKASIDNIISVNVFAPETSYITYDTTKFEAIVSGAANFSDVDLKADMFAAAATELGNFDDANKLLDAENLARQAFAGVEIRGEAITDMTNAMTTLLQSDTTGIVDKLAFGEHFDGEPMAQYARQMLLADKETELGEVMARLQTGNQVGGIDPITYLEQQVTSPSGEPLNRNAQTLGYFTGAVYVAAESISGDVQEQRDFVNSILKSSLTVFDKSKIWGTLAGATASVSKEWVSRGIGEILNDPGLTAAQALDRAALPEDPQSGEIALGNDAQSAYERGVTRVRRLNE
ncbi:MAG: hypothetical protein AAGJ50_12340, partial [Pseudomonadota bacterium]